MKSSVKKHDPTYRLHVRYEAPSGKKWEDKQITGKFTEWFNTYGYLDKKAFQSWLAKNIEVVESAAKEASKIEEKHKAKGEEKQGADAEDTITVASGTESQSAAAQATPAKRARPKKKP